MNKESACTIFRNVFDKKPYHITIEDALARIKTGKSKSQIERIRNTIDDNLRGELKSNLPSVCFSGIFSERKDEKLLQHSGFICLDFDHLDDVLEEKSLLCANDYIYACWVSPSGNGLKALVRIGSGIDHEAHFEALMDIFKTVDRSGRNISRVCYESYDPDIFINEKSIVFKKIKTIERIKISENQHDSYESFRNLLKWLANRGDAFVTGERNNFIFKLASACCRFGMSADACTNLCIEEFLLGQNSFSRIELQRTIASAYKKNKDRAGTAYFEKEKLIYRQTLTEVEVEIEDDIYNLEIRPKDVIFGIDVKGEAINIYDNGYEKLDGIGVPELDEIFKLKRGEISLLSGIGNYGKSSFLKWFLLMRVIIFEEKFALFSPEDNPAHEFYHDCVEILSGQKCTPDNPFRPSRDLYESYYDFVSSKIFYVYPKDLAPTPEYIKERFLELIIKEKISGCIIDPFNQMTNDYKSAGGRSDKYLEFLLADFARFAQQNQVFFLVVAHPRSMRKEQDGNYPCPDVFDIADGAMWNNKMDNILIYHRPEHQTNPMSSLCELHTKKIRRQRMVGKKGFIQFGLHPSFKRFLFNGVDHMKNVLESNAVTEPSEPF